ncbi:unnamed protein product, partial [Discosporangium mesarthrocarpum]
MQAVTRSGRSISCYIFPLAGTAISWSSKLQPVVAQSTTEAEYNPLGDTAKKGMYLDSFITKLEPFKMEIITIHEDKQHGSFSSGFQHLLGQDQAHPRSVSLSEAARPRGGNTYQARGELGAARRHPDQAS